MSINMMSIVSILTCIFESIVILMFVNTYADQRKKIPVYLHTAAIIILALLIIISNRLANITILNLVFIGFSIFAVSFLYNKNIKINIMIAIILVLIFTITEIVTLFIIMSLTGLSEEEANIIDSYRFLGIVLSKLFAFIVLKLISVNHKSNTVFTMRISYWVLFCSIFLTSVIAIYLLYIFQYNSNITGIYKHLAVWCSFGLLYNTFFSLYLYERIIKQSETERNQEIFKQQIKAQSKHLNEILITQKQMKKLRHDLINHNISIQAYFENQDCKSGLEYMKKFNQNAAFTDNMIETGNIALDAIINTKKSIAVSEGIIFDTKIHIPENIFVDAIDICIIFGNALDNCIEACKKIENGIKRISLSIIYEDDSLICKFVNTAVKPTGKFLHTTKSDHKNHGFGIDNIKSALQKYRNVYQFTQTDTEFILSFIIFKN